MKIFMTDENGREQQEIDGKTISFKEINYIDAQGGIGDTKNISLNSYTGYEVNSFKEFAYFDNEDGAEVRDEGVLTAVSPGAAAISISLDLDLISKEIHIYYLKKVYPVKITYEISSDDNAKFA